MPTVQLTGEEYDTLRNAKIHAENVAAELRNELVVARATDPSGRIMQLTTLARAMLDVAKFAVANLPPETTVGWPTARLLAVTQLLQHLPDFDVNDEELVVELQAFIREVQQHDRRRYTERQQQQAS
jgi:hypothetical protein